MAKLNNKLSQFKKKRQLEKLDLGQIPKFSFKGQEFVARVYRCIDGDTIECVFKYNKCYSKFTIRMLGYNSPELRPKKGTYQTEEEREEIKRKAQLAKKRLEELIMDKIVWVSCDKFDDWRRILATIKLSKKDTITINQQMLDEGHGVPFAK